MDFKVKYNSKYVELIVKDGSATIETGLLDEHEASNLAGDLISAAEDLLDGEAFQILLKEYLEKK